MLTTLRIDPEFQALIPPMRDDELARLEASLAAEGCRDALMVWTPSDGDGVPILLDGHHRYAWCQRTDQPFRLIEAHGIQTRDDAKIWIIQNQLGRRNLEPFARIELAEQLRPLLEAQAKERQVEGGREKGFQNSGNPVHTDRELAKVAGVSHDTMHKARIIAAEADEPTKQAVRRGERSIHSAYKELRPPAPKEPVHTPAIDHLSDPVRPSISIHSAQEASDTAQCGFESHTNQTNSHQYFQLEPDAPEEGHEWDNWIETVENLVESAEIVLEGLRQHGGIATVLRDWPNEKKWSFYQQFSHFGEQWQQVAAAIKTECETVSVSTNS